MLAGFVEELDERKELDEKDDENVELQCRLFDFSSIFLQFFLNFDLFVF